MEKGKTKPVNPGDGGSAPAGAQPILRPVITAIRIGAQRGYESYKSSSLTVGGLPRKGEQQPQPAAKSMTVPDETMTMKQIMEKFVRGQDVRGGLVRRGWYGEDDPRFDDPDLEAVSRMDATEVAEMAEEQRKNTEAKKAAVDEIERKQKAADEEAEREQQEDDENRRTRRKYDDARGGYESDDSEPSASRGKGGVKPRPSTPADSGVSKSDRRR